MTKLGLAINEAKTSLRNVRQERFDFLGYSFGPHYPYRWNGQWYVGASPSKKSMQRLKAKVRELLVPSNNEPWQDVRDAEQNSARLVELLLSRNAAASIPQHRLLCPRACARFPRQAAQSGRARQ